MSMRYRNGRLYIDCEMWRDAIKKIKEVGE